MRYNRLKMTLLHEYSQYDMIVTHNAHFTHNQAYNLCSKWPSFSRTYGFSWTVNDAIE